MNIQRLDIPLQLKKEPDDDGYVEGYGSIFDLVDNGNDVVNKGAFEASLNRLSNAGRRIKMLWQHDPNTPIGIWDEAFEDQNGLFLKGRIMKETKAGAECMALLKAGAIDGLSMGYRTVKAVREGAQGSIRRLMEVDLWEVSFVTFPMLPSATITSIKSMETIRDFETALRDVGFTQRQAKAIAADGFKGLKADYRDGDGDDAQSEQALDRLFNSMASLQETFK